MPSSGLTIGAASVSATAFEFFAGAERAAARENDDLLAGIEQSAACAQQVLLGRETRAARADTSEM